MRAGQVREVVVARDYSHGMEPTAFARGLPRELEERGVAEHDFLELVDTVNELFREAETVGWNTVFESVFGCLSCYSIFLCYRSEPTGFVFPFFFFFDEFFSSKARSSAPWTSWMTFYGSRYAAGFNASLRDVSHFCSFRTPRSGCRAGSVSRILFITGACIWNSSSILASSGGNEKFSRKLTVYNENGKSKRDCIDCCIDCAWLPAILLLFSSFLA